MSNLCKLYLFFLFGLPKAFSAPRQPRLSLAENFMPQYFVRNINGNPDTYSFGYDISDPSTGNIQFRNEERYPNGTVIGSYGYVDPSGKSLTYKYVADHNGYRITQDFPNKHYANYEAQNPIQQPLPDSEESTITWTRPRKPVKKNDDNLGRNTSHDNIAILGDVVSGPR